MNLRSLVPALGSTLSLLRRRRIQLVSVVALMVGRSLMEILGILISLPLLAVVGVPAGELAIGSVRLGVWPPLGPGMAFPVILATLVSVVALHGLIRFHERILAATMVESIRCDLRSRLFRAIAKADWPFHLRHRHSRMIQTTNEEITRVGGSLAITLRLISLSVSVLALTALALVLSAPLTVLAMISYAAGSWLLRNHVVRPRAAVATDPPDHRAMERTIRRFLEGLKTAKSQADEDSYVSTFENTSAAHSAAWVRGMKAHAEMGSLERSGLFVGSAVLGWIAIAVFTIPVATAIVLLYVGARLGPRIAQVRRDAGALLRETSAGARFERLVDEAMEAQEPGTWHGAPTPPLREGIRLDRVGFQSETADSDTPNILDISLEIPAYRITAFIGSPGGGTSTIGDVLGGLIIPQSGQILVDGRPLSGGDYRGWRRRIGYVSPDAFMPEGTLRYILGATPGSERDEELLRALRVVQLDGLVDSLPEGLDTHIGAGEGGRNLRDQDRLRLALARALLRRPQLLVIDETSDPADDASDDAAIRRALSMLRGRVTVLITSHRLSLVREADLIHVIEGGNLVESGTWTQLRESGERFRAIIAAEAGRDQRRAREAAGVNGGRTLAPPPRAAGEASGPPAPETQRGGPPHMNRVSSAD